MTTYPPKDGLSIGSLETLKVHLQNLNSTEFSDLQKTYHYRWIVALLRSTGWVNVFLGGITLWLGLSAATMSIPKSIQALIGTAAIILSLWAILRPTLSAVLGYCVLFLTAGIWNIFVASADGFNGLALLVGILGLLQLWWAFSYYRIHQKYSPMSLTKPGMQNSRLYDEIWRTLTKTKIEDADLIRLQMPREWWQGFLLHDLAVLAQRRSKTVMIARERDVTFAPSSPKATSQKRVKGRIKFDSVSAWATVPQESFAQYIRWKSMDDTEKPQWLLDAPKTVQGLHLPNFIRIPLLVIGSLILLYIVFIVIGVVQLIIKYR